MTRGHFSATSPTPTARPGSASDGMAHAHYDGDWKLTIDIRDKPAALYHLKTDLIENNNLIANPAQAERIKAMEQAYLEISPTKKPTTAP